MIATNIKNSINENKSYQKIANQDLKIINIISAIHIKDNYNYEKYLITNGKFDKFYVLAPKVNFYPTTEYVFFSFNSTNNFLNYDFAHDLYTEKCDGLILPLTIVKKFVPNYKIRY